MKKIFTLVAASLFTMAAFAADRRPSVTVQANKKFTIVIDGKRYYGSNAGTISIANLRDGYHTVTVYNVQKDFSKRLREQLLLRPSCFVETTSTSLSICLERSR